MGVIRRCPYLVVMFGGMAAGHHMLVLAARLGQAYAARRRTPDKEQVAAIRFIRL